MKLVPILGAVAGFKAASSWVRINNDSASGFVAKEAGAMVFGGPSSWTAGQSQIVGALSVGLSAMAGYVAYRALK